MPNVNDNANVLEAKSTIPSVNSHMIANPYLHYALHLYGALSELT